MYTHPGPEADEQAIADIRTYLSPNQWDAVMQLVGNPDTTINDINFCLAGVSGYPFHAFCRHYALDKYRAWMAEGPVPIETDERGFRLD